MKNRMVFAGLLTFIFSIVYAQNKSQTYLFIGSYTGGKPDTGIYVCSFNEKSGALKVISSIDDITNPSFLTLAPDGKYLYAGADTQLPDTGSVMAFKVDASLGRLTFINRQPSGGDNPVYVAVHPDQNFLINANYTGGSMSAYSINEDGSLHPFAQLIPFQGSSIIKSRQEKSHIHASVFSPDGDFIFLPDLGADKIWVLPFDVSQSEPISTTDNYTITTLPGSGPRHFTFHPNGRFAYCIEELSGTVAAYGYDSGMLTFLQRIFGYSKQQDSYGGADIHISPDGRFLYSSNRWEDENTIAIFSIDPQTGILKMLGHQKTLGDHPRNFTIDPTGKFLLVANMLSNNVVVFKRNKKTGLLKKTKHEIVVPGPSCLQMRRY